jgi:hypothetical protein
MHQAVCVAFDREGALCLIGLNDKLLPPEPAIASILFEELQIRVQ